MRFIGNIIYVWVLFFMLPCTHYGQVVLINDDFSTWPQGWRDTVRLQGCCSPGGCGMSCSGNCCQSLYIVDQDGTTGNPAPSAHIYNDGSSFAVAVLIRINVDVSSCTGNLILSFDYRASSSTSASTVTNAILQIFDAVADSLIFSTAIVAGGTTNTGWQPYSIDLTSIIQSAGVCSIIIGLGTSDGWIANWNKQVWFDNVRLECNTGGGASICTPLPYLPLIRSIQFIPPSSVHLQWSLETTEPVILERGLDPIHFTPVDTIWNINFVDHTYQYLDQLPQPLANSYFYRYRLLYSTVASEPQALFLHESRPSFVVFPNPSGGEFAIWSSQGGIYELADALGKTIRSYEKHGNEVLVIKESLPPGIYFIKEQKTGRQLKVVIR